MTDPLPGSDWRPRPDPTLLTTEALLREVARLEALLSVRIKGIEDIEAEKFRRVEQQFDLVEQQRVEQKSDTKAAVDAALTAQKEAVKEQTTASGLAIAKSEAATAKQLEQLSTTFNAAFDGMRREVADLKERVTSVEQQKVGGKEASTGIYAFAGFILVMLTIAAIVAAFAQ